jgi:hypothetical protein
MIKLGKKLFQVNFIFIMAPLKSKMLNKVLLCIPSGGTNIKDKLSQWPP